MTEAEDRICTDEDNMASLITQTTTMKAAMEELVLKWMTCKIEPAAQTSAWWVCRSQQKEVTFAFLEKWIPDMHGEYNFPGPAQIERAHQLGRMGWTWTTRMGINGLWCNPEWC